MLLQKKANDFMKKERYNIRNGKRRKKGVLILSPFYYPNMGGLETHLLALTEYLRQHDHNVVVLTYKPLTVKVKHYKKYEKEKNLEIHRVWWFGYNYFEKLANYPVLQFLYMLPGLLFYSLSYLLKNRNKIDVIHAHGFIAAFTTRIITILFKKKAVMSTHYIYNFKEKTILANIFKWTTKTFSKILALGKKSKEDLLAANINEEKIMFYSQWVNQDLFKPLNKNKCKRKFNLQKEFVVLFVGRLLEMKGVKILVEVSKKFTKNVKFVFVGDGPLANELKDAASKNNNIVFVGKKDPKELIYYYGASDLVVLPSTEEANPLVVSEALSCKRPIVTTNKGSIVEMFDNSVGIKINPTVKNVYKTIKYFFDNPRKLKKMTSRCRKYALNKFSERNAKTIENSYYR